MTPVDARAAPSWLVRWRDEQGDTTALGLVRIALGVLLLEQAIVSLHELVAYGYFGDGFHVPLLPEVLVPSRAVYTALVVARIILAIIAVVGRRAREALLASALLGMHLGLCDRGRLHNNQYALLCFAFLLSFAPCDRTFVLVPEKVRPPRIGPMWAQRLVQAQLSIVYVASGGAKLLDADWRRGLVLAGRLARHAEQADAGSLTEALYSWLSHPAVASLLAKGAIATELFLAVGLWTRRTRVFALVLGISFHLLIELTSKVQVFTWVTLSIYVLFALPLGSHSNRSASIGSSCDARRAG